MFWLCTYNFFLVDKKSFLLLFFIFDQNKANDGSNFSEGMFNMIQASYKLQYKQKNGGLKN